MAETKHYGLIAGPFSCTAPGEEVEGSGWGEGGFSFLLGHTHRVAVSGLTSK